MTLLLLRHASAGHRLPGTGDDSLRSLDHHGRRQSDGLMEQLDGFGVERILTSPYVRCRQTVEPLAAALGLPIENRAELAEGAAAEEIAALVAELGDATAVLCTHGDVVLALLGEESAKGSTWVLEPGPDGLSRREYLPPAA